MIAVLLLISAGTLFQALRASSVRNADQAYHAAIPKTLVVNSDDFRSGEDIPVSFTCRGAGISPELSWDHAPESALSYAIIVMDWDDPLPMFRLGNFTHWILYNIPAAQRKTGSAVTETDLNQANIEIGENSAGAKVYVPPCPPLGRHSYIFRIYAVDVDQIHPTSRDRDAVLGALKGHLLAFGEIVGRFGN